MQRVGARGASGIIYLRYARRQLPIGTELPRESLLAALNELNVLWWMEMEMEMPDIKAEGFFAGLTGEGLVGTGVSTGTAAAGGAEAQHWTQQWPAAVKPVLASLL